MFFWKVDPEVTKKLRNPEVTKGNQKRYLLMDWKPVCRGVYIQFQNQSLHFLLSSFFLKLSQPLGQDQQNSKQIYCRLSITIFLWTPKGLISPESFFNFLLILYIPWQFRKSFKFIVLRLLQLHLWVKKLNLFNFTQAPKQNFPPDRQELLIPLEQYFLKI